MWLTNVKLVDWIKYDNFWKLILYVALQRLVSLSRPNVIFSVTRRDVFAGDIGKKNVTGNFQFVLNLIQFFLLQKSYTINTTTLLSISLQIIIFYQKKMYYYLDRIPTYKMGILQEWLLLGTTYLMST